MDLQPNMVADVHVYLAQMIILAINVYRSATAIKLRAAFSSDLDKENSTFNIAGDYIKTTEVTDSEESTINDWVIYTLSLAGFIIVIGLSHLYRTYRHKVCRKVQIENVADVVERGAIPETADTVYFEIDESAMVDMNSIRTGISKATLEHRNDVNEKRDFENDDNNYLYPYHSIEEKESEKSTKRESGEKSTNTSKSNSSSESILSEKSGNLNPYHPLQDEWQKSSHEYVIPVVIHRNETSSSESEKENGLEGYIYPYQSLMKDMAQISGAYMYDKCKINEKSGSDLLIASNEVQQRANQEFDTKVADCNKVSNTNKQRVRSVEQLFNKDNASTMFLKKAISCDQLLDSTVCNEYITVYDDPTLDKPICEKMLLTKMKMPL